MSLRMPAIHLRFAVRDHYLWIALIAEFLGAGLYQLLAGSAGDEPLQSALTLVAIMYATKYISGGHINPAVSLAALLSGHIDYIRGFAYIAAQVLGAIFGALLQAGMSPDSTVGQAGPGCFAPIKDIPDWKLVAWEAVLTFLLLTVAYASLFVRPGHGDAAPVAIGLALFAALATGGAYTGASPLNPARVFAGSLVFKCWGHTLQYICGQLTGAVLAAGWALLVFGKGTFFQHTSATTTLRESLLPGAGNEPAGELGTFAPQGHHYAGSQPADE